MLEKFKNLQWHFQLIILVVTAGLLLFFVDYFYTSETRAETATILEEVAAIRQKNEMAEIAVSRINEHRAQYEAKAAEYEELKVLLPEQREITNVLQGLQDTANDKRLIVMRFSPRDDSQKDSIMAKPVEVEVDSNFTNLRSFFDAMAKLPRIVSITDFSISQLDKQSADKTLHARFVLTAYYAAPTDLNAKPAVPGAPGAAPVAGAPGAVPVAPAVAK